jgi:amino acid transporter
MMKLLPYILPLFAVFARKASAQDTNPVPNLFISLGSGQNTFAGVAGLMLNLILAISGMVGIMYLVLGGTQYMMSGASEELAKSGKKRVQNAIIGLIIIILSYTIITVVFNTLVEPPTPNPTP